MIEKLNSSIHNRNMKRISKIFLGILCLGLSLSGCSRGGGFEPTPDPDTPGTGDIFDPIDLGPGQEIEDRTHYYSNQDYDVSPDYKLKVTIEGDPSSFEYASSKQRLLQTSKRRFRSPEEDSFVIQNDEGETYNTVVTEKRDEDGTYYEITPQGGTYEEGSIMSVKVNDPNINFKGKDPSMETLYFNIAAPEQNYMHISKDVPFFSIDKVVSFPVPDADYPEITDLDSEEAAEFFETATYHFIYQDNSFSYLNENKQFGVSVINNGTPDLRNDNTFYGRFVKCEPEGNYCKVTYKNADLSEIFKDDQTGDTAFSVYQHEDDAEMKNIKILAENGALEKALKDLDSIKKLSAAVGEVVGSEAADILSKFSVDVSFSCKDNTLNIQIKLSGTYRFESDPNLAIQVTLVFQWAIGFDADGGVKIKKFLGVPYKLKAYGTVTKTTDFTFQLQIKLMHAFDPQKPDERSIKDQIKDAYSKLENDPAYFMPRTDKDPVYTANHISQPLCSLDVPFGYIFDFHIGLSFEFTLDLNIMFQYGYHSHTVEKMLAFSTSDGIENTSNATEQSCSTHTLDLGGNLYIEAGLRLTISIGICGLKNLFTLGAYVEGGLYLDLKAMGGVSFGEDQQTTFYGGFSFQFGLYGKIEGFMDFLFVFHPKFTFAKEKLPLIGFSIPITIMDLFSEDITTSQKTLNIDDTKLLTGKCFDPNTFAISIKTFHLYDRYDSFDSEKKQPIKLTTDSEFISFDEASNSINVSNKAPAHFSCAITAIVEEDYASSFYGSTSKTINFTYTSENARRIIIGDDGPEFYLETGDVFFFPYPDKDSTLGDKQYFYEQSYQSDYSTISFKYTYDDTYYDLVSFTDGKHEYYPGDAYVVQNSDVRITVRLHVIIYYTVNWYRGDMSLIKSAVVKEKTDATEFAPTPEECAMEGWLFYGWDRDFTFIDEDTNIYGIYVKGSTK